MYECFGSNSGQISQITLSIGSLTGMQVGDICIIHFVLHYNLSNIILIPIVAVLLAGVLPTTRFYSHGTPPFAMDPTPTQYFLTIISALLYSPAQLHSFMTVDHPSSHSSTDTPQPPHLHRLHIGQQQPNNTRINQQR